MSSRNAYLSPADRRAALVLHRGLEAVRTRYEAGERAGPTLTQILRDAISAEPLARLDYAAVVDPDTLLPLDQVSGPALAAVAAWFGQTRLIDNTPLQTAGTPSACSPPDSA